jgi:hypothetical protein
MLYKSCICLLLVAISGSTVQAVGKKKVETAPTVQGRKITTDEARAALNTLMESKSFLSDATFMEPLKKRIIAENKKESILVASTSSSAPGGRFIGSWNVEISANEFFYFAKSPARDELFTIRGTFLLGQDNKWTAKISEASAAKLTNFFGKTEYDKIRLGMHIDEVIKILGSPPGAYFAGEMGFGYPDGIRRNWPFTGTSKEFQKGHTRFFATKPNVDQSDTFTRAWISNDLAIWMIFDDGNKVFQKHCSEVRCPNDCHREVDEIARKLIEQLNKKELPKGK